MSELKLYKKLRIEVNELRSRTSPITGVCEISREIDVNQAEVSHAFHLNLAKKIEVLKKTRAYINRKIKERRNGRR